jgi:hypothetical protein
MDGKGRCLDNVFIERLWRSLKYECVYLHAWETGSQARVGIGRWITFYNHQRPHAAHGGQPPAVAYFNTNQTDKQVQAVAYPLKGNIGDALFAVLCASGHNTRKILAHLRAWLALIMTAIPAGQTAPPLRDQALTPA